MVPSIDSTDHAVRRLRAGGVLVLATDTIPGLHCRADNPTAIARLVDLKGRPAGKPLLVLAGSIAQALTVTGPLNPAQLAACERCWPGPFSLILPAAAHVNPTVTAGGQTVAVRIPALTALRDLLLAVGTPLVSSSANRAGDDPAGDLVAAERVFGSEVDGYWGEVNAGSSATTPSAVVDLTVFPFSVSRQGPRDFPGA